MDQTDNFKTTLKPEVKKLWCDALRSGEYTQSKRALTIINEDKTESDCCLGVLCKVAIKDGLTLPVVIEGTYRVYACDTQILPPSVSKWAGIDCNNPSVSINGHKDLLAAHNDAGRTFAEIADAIEEQL